MKQILFNTEMVRATLDGRKTVTRRVVKPNSIFQGWSILGRDKSMIQTPNGFGFLISNGEKSVETLMYMPYRPGDILCVRETFFKYAGEYVYRASAAQPELWEGMWHPSIHMPKEAARIFLRVTDVRVERLQEITEEQARAEGVKGWMVATDRNWDKNPNHLIAFRHLLDSTIKSADRALYGWDANPWVWINEFDQISKEEALRCT